MCYNCTNSHSPRDQTRQRWGIHRHTCEHSSLSLLRCGPLHRASFLFFWLSPGHSGALGCFVTDPIGTWQVLKPKTDCGSRTPIALRNGLYDMPHRRRQFPALVLASDKNLHQIHPSSRSHRGSELTDWTCHARRLQPLP